MIDLHVGLGACCTATSILLVYLWRKHRYLYVKPSVVFALLFNLLMQWPSYYYYQSITIDLTGHFRMSFSLSPLSL